VADDGHLPVRGDPKAAEGTAAEPSYGALGLAEQELRETLEQDLQLAVGAEREPSAHAIAHSVTLLIEQDHLHIAE
jgi:hypothetical protein